ncbi:beta-propeller domain-containing protein [Paenibacillus thalictri]|uniref:Copper amine oxidase-like N-terminal domain-containing protein n=1 Tax=Paenibacillus thalictri TaxID=2527873 RepID=A0A4Q9DZJ7_9BACL|nr:beta-propeller domain-containing protein [Paenibacillus thalictri]TBL81273.1 hypothetical protein EYB31_04070 [Paenibacillus thalictri]
MKKLVILGSLVFLSAASGPVIAPQVMVTASASAETVKLTLDGQQLQFAVLPRMQNGTLFVPLRDLGSALGADITWEEGAGSATISKGDANLSFTLGSAAAVRNGKQLEMASAPVMEQGQMLVPLRLISETFDFNVYWDGANKAVEIMNGADSLPTVGTFDKLQALLKESAPDGGIYVNGGIAVLDQAGAKLKVNAKSEAAPQSGSSSIAQVAPMAKDSASAAPTAPPAGASAAANSAKTAAPGDYSKTNVQVEGVDEADVIKTDGNYIYQVNRNRILVVEANPPGNMKVVSTLQFDNREMIPSELYVDGSHLIVIGSAVTSPPIAAVPAASDAPQSDSKVKTSETMIKIVPPRFARKTMTKAVVYDLSDKTQLTKVREIELEGNYVTSRKVGSSFYLVANKYMNRYQILNAKPAADGSTASITDTPTYRDSLAGDSYISVGLEDVRYFPKSAESNYLIVAGVNLDQPDQKLSVQTYLGAGDNVYASTSNLYVTMQKYERVPAVTNSSDASGLTTDSVTLTTNTASAIYKFALDQGSIRYTAQGTVPGRVLNQYSMDETNGYFRIATTSGEEWRRDEFTSQNNMYVLNDKLETAGKIENIAPGERIYSVRFMGSRAYMVTFRTVDPLFVIDLKDAAAPKILGQLKIPGYSDYLHPYDENHIIGFGKDTVEIKNDFNGSGGAPATMAYYQGMKLAMFDVTDVTQPTELFKETIGDRGTDSPLLHNPKALLFSKEKGLLAFPVSVSEIPDKSANPDPKEMLKYGQFAFQGAYVYHIDLTGGFQLRGKITHLTSDELAKAGSWYNGDHSIERLLYIGDNLYTASKGMLKASDLNTLQQLGELELK